MLGRILELTHPNCRLHWVVASSPRAQSPFSQKKKKKKKKDGGGGGVRVVSSSILGARGYYYRRVAVCFSVRVKIATRATAGGSEPTIAPACRGRGGRARWANSGCSRQRIHCAAVTDALIGRGGLWAGVGQKFKFRPSRPAASTSAWRSEFRQLWQYDRIFHRLGARAFSLTAAQRPVGDLSRHPGVSGHRRLVRDGRHRRLSPPTSELRGWRACRTDPAE